MKLIATTHERPLKFGGEVPIEYFITSTAQKPLSGCIGPLIRVYFRRGDEPGGTIEHRVNSGKCFPDLYFVLRTGQTMHWQDKHRITFPGEPGEYRMWAMVQVKEPDLFKGQERAPSWEVISEPVQVLIEK
jgi:hypothetical protein